MSNSPIRFRVFRGWVFLLCLSVVAGLALTAWLLSSSKVPAGATSESSGIYVFEDGSLRYAFHAVSGTEYLYDLQSDPRCLENLVSTQPVETARLRMRMLGSFGVQSLVELRQEFIPTTLRLRGLGYL